MREQIVQYSDLRSLTRDALLALPRHILLHSEAVGVGCVQRPPEAAYQDALRYTLHHVLGRTAMISLEWCGGTTGKIDFFHSEQEVGY